MSDLQHLAPHELLARIENRNRRFKVASVVFGAVLLSGLIVLLVLGLDTLEGVNAQLAQQKKLLDSQHQILTSIKSGSDQNAAHVNDLQNHIDCIVELFRQPNRAALTIKDLNGCQLDSSGNVITGSTGGTNGTQKNGTINSSGGTATSPQSTVPSQPAQANQPDNQPKPVQALFCKIDLAHLTC